MTEGNKKLSLLSYTCGEKGLETVITDGSKRVIEFRSKFRENMEHIYRKPLC